MTNSKKYNGQQFTKHSKSEHHPVSRISAEVSEEVGDRGRNDIRCKWKTTGEWHEVEGFNNDATEHFIHSENRLIFITFSI